jgi:NAD(P)-dependent dehydrogenase (short-subunit alcohol dehydrogenase family)
MIERGGGGALVVVSSVSAIDGAPRMQHYASSKAGVLALMRALAVELARHRIRCNAILPGWTATDMGPAAVFLADPSYTFHTGDALVVDGGYTIF